MTMFKVPPEVHQHEIKNVCRDFMNGKCAREGCRFIHDTQLCSNYWKRGSCKFGEHCRKNHFVVDNRKNTNTNSNTNLNSNTKTKNHPHTNPRRKPKNTESYEHWTDPFSMRVVYDLGNFNEKLHTQLTSRDILLVPNLFKDFKTGELYGRLVYEIENCKVPKEDLLKLWHGSEHLNIEGKHHICNDRTKWKQECPTFTMVIERMKEFFGVTEEATRLNWYKDGTEYKPRHHDAAAMDPKKAEKQNITIGLSFSKGDKRDIVFENVSSRQAICIPQGDGDIYTFGNQVNVEWKHGVNPGIDSSLGRISIIIWGWVDGVIVSTKK